jgi:hypothetical protein
MEALGLEIGLFRPRTFGYRPLVGGIEGQPEPVVGVTIRLRVSIAIRRPAIRCGVVPATAT